MAAEAEIWKSAFVLRSAAQDKLLVVVDSHLRPQHLHPASVFFTAAPRMDPSDIPLPGIGWVFLPPMED